MKDQTDWRPMSPEEAAVIRSILSQANIRCSGPLIADLDGALVANATTWILDVKVSNNGEVADLPNGPFPAQVFVPNSAEYQGEVIIWITDGHVSGLEYAWVSDDPPSRWPRADEMEVVLQENSYPSKWTLVDSSFRFLSTTQADLLNEILASRSSTLLERVRQANSVSRSDAEEIMSVISDELTNTLDDDWEPTEYGRTVSALMAQFNAARIQEWP